MAGALRIQLCESNRLAARSDLLRALQAERPGTRIYRDKCLDRCVNCAQCAVALVNGTFLYAKTPEEFVQKLLLLSPRR